LEAANVPAAFNLSRQGTGSPRPPRADPGVRLSRTGLLPKVKRCDFEGDVADAVCKGRREEFSRFPEFQDPEQRDRIADPLAEKTFKLAKLDWSAIDQKRLALYRNLLAVRRREIVPLRPHIVRGGSAIEFGPGAVQVRWQIGLDRVLALSANLSGKKVEFPESTGQTIWSEGEIDPGMGPWSVRWSVEAA
jgi:maltooligosyltrehalose trehalohydrolase